MPERRGVLAWAKTCHRVRQGHWGGGTIGWSAF
jgi:hypothetical protein